jgi:carbohydrate diacid regulator
MFELDHDLAQDIVDRAMAILPCNVNVMDSQGLILGSGEPERINTRHEGAQLVLANGRVVEIDAPTAKHLKGVQPGINLPLMLDQRLIGVLGITGEPEQLRTYAELVRMTAEMLVSQRISRPSSNGGASVATTCWPCCWRAATRRGWSMKPSNWGSSRRWRAPCLFELGAGQTAEALSAWLTSRYPDSWCVSSAQSSLLWCRPAVVQVDNPRLLEKLDGLGWNILRSPSAGRPMGWPVCAAVIGGSATCWPMGARCPQSRLLTLNRYRAGDALAPSQRRRPG